MNLSDFFTKIKDGVDSWTGDYFGLYIPDITWIDVLEVIILAFLVRPIPLKMV